jgi:hypothetical protein
MASVATALDGRGPVRAEPGEGVAGPPRTQGVWPRPPDAWVRGARRWALEAAVVLGPDTALPVIALVLVTLLHATAPALGPESWRALFVENCASFLPVGLALAVVPALLRDAEHGTLDAAIGLPARRIAAARLTVLLGGGAALAALWLGVLAAFWGPVPYGAGLYAAMGPTLFLSGLGLLSATLAGRATVGYLTVIGWPLGDLVLRLLGAFQAAPPLQWLDVFAYRWPLPHPEWSAVDAVQAVVGALLLLQGGLRARQLLRRLL